MSLAVEQRVDSLEAVLGAFIVSTNSSLIRMERGITGLRIEMKDFKDEMKDFKDEMKDFKDEMKDFKDEMKDFKDETRADRKKMYREWGDLANKMGTICEDMVAPNISGIARDYFGIKEVDFFAVRVRKVNFKDRSLKREFDVIAVSKDSFIVTEVKSNSRQSYIDEFLDVLKHIPDYFPESEGKRLIPIFASLYIPENILRYLTKNGIYAMAIKDDTMAILNFEKIEKMR
ncbi:MAG: hypothetical protein J7L16_09815 [Deltaproteobacteria bacterium]|nr:hypothetical protein [Deltaproteobacteria bacterium]